MTLGRQFPGTEKHPQGRLFKPEFTGDPHKLSPSNWMSQDASKPMSRRASPMTFGNSKADQGTADRDGGDILTFHTNMGDNLHTREQPLRVQPKSRDSKGRPMGEDGSTIGTHFGTVKAGLDRTAHQGDPSRAVSHAVKLPASKQFGRGDVMGPGGQPLSMSGRVVPWMDETANTNEGLTDAVEAGGVVAYENYVEDEGSISYRALRSTARTWSEDVLAAPKSGIGAPHPAYQHLASKGYNPVVESGKIREAIAYQPRQLPLTVTSHDVPGKNVMGEPLRFGGPINPIRGEGVDKFSQRNVDVYNEETSRIHDESRGISGDQFSKWTMRKNTWVPPQS